MSLLPRVSVCCVTCGSPLMLPSSESDCWSGSLSSPWNKNHRHEGYRQVSALEIQMIKEEESGGYADVMNCCASWRVTQWILNTASIILCVCVCVCVCVSLLHPGSRRRPRWSVSFRGAACDPVWSGAETCPLPPSPPPFGLILCIDRNDDRWRTTLRTNSRFDLTLDK